MTVKKHRSQGDGELLLRQPKRTLIRGDKAAEAPGRRFVLSIGRNLDATSIGPIAANTIVVPHAPHLPLLERASLCITHAGLNTTLEALSAGYP